MDIYTIRFRRKTGNGAAENRDIYDGSPDAEFMKSCREVDINLPKTWDRYDITTAAGMKKIIDMEYKELMTATAPENITENIYHLSVALLRFWRLHHDHHTNISSGAD